VREDFTDQMADKNEQQNSTRCSPQYCKKQATRKMTRYEKLDNLQPESVIGLCIGYKNYTTDFSDCSQELMKEDLVKLNAPYAAVANFNNGYDGPGIPPWTMPDPDKNHITTQQAQELIGHDLPSFDRSIRFVTSLVAQNGLIRPAIFALEGQYPEQSRAMEDEIVLGAFSPEGAMYDNIVPAIEAARELRLLCRGKPANLDADKFFKQDEIPDYLAKSYEDLENIYRKNNNLLSATIIESGVPLGIALRKIGKQEAHKKLLSDAILVLSGSAHARDSCANFSFHGEVAQCSAFAKPYSIPETYQENGEELVVSLNPAADMTQELQSLQANYARILRNESMFTQNAIIAEEALRNAAVRAGFYPQKPQNLIPPLSPLDMIKSSVGRTAMIADSYASIRRQQIEKQASRKSSRPRSFLEKIRKLCAT
jgi:hypothetical protein